MRLGDPLGVLRGPWGSQGRGRGERQPGSFLQYCQRTAGEPIPKTLLLVRIEKFVLRNICLAVAKSYVVLDVCVFVIFVFLGGKFHVCFFKRIQEFSPARFVCVCYHFIRLGNVFLFCCGRCNSIGGPCCVFCSRIC